MQEAPGRPCPLALLAVPCASSRCLIKHSSVLPASCMRPSASFNTRPPSASIVLSLTLTGLCPPITLWLQPQPPSVRLGHGGPQPSACGRCSAFRTGYSLPTRSPCQPVGSCLPLGQLLTSGEAPKGRQVWTPLESADQTEPPGPGQGSSIFPAPA